MSDVKNEKLTQTEFKAVSAFILAEMTQQIIKLNRDFKESSRGKRLDPQRVSDVSFGISMAAEYMIDVAETLSKEAFAEAKNDD